MKIQEIPLVTIAIPTYNRGKTFLPQTLQSALDQSYPNLEIIVSDNASTDDTESVVKAFNDPRIRYVRHSQNIGHCRNFNFCIETAKGYYFLLLQDDDLIDPDFIDLCLRTVDYGCANVGVFRTGVRFIDLNGKRLGEWSNKVGGLSGEEFLLAYLSFETGIYLCGTLWNAKKLQEIGGLQSKHNLFLDVMAVAKLAMQFGRRDIQECKASNRKHPTELTYSVKFREWWEESLLLIDEFCDLVADEEMKSRLKKQGEKFIFRHNFNLVKRKKGIVNRWKLYCVIFQKCGFSVFAGQWIKYAVLSGWNSIKKTVKQMLRVLGRSEKISGAH